MLRKLYTQIRTTADAVPSSSSVKVLRAGARISANGTLPTITVANPGTLKSGDICIVLRSGSRVGTSLTVTLRSNFAQSGGAFNATANASEAYTPTAGDRLVLDGSVSAHFAPLYTTDVPSDSATTAAVTIGSTGVLEYYTSAHDVDLTITPSGGSVSWVIDIPTEERPAIKPEEFGAVGDGSTDDALAIQTAIDYLENAGGGTLCFSQKTYIVGTKLTHASDTISVVGNGATLKIANSADLTYLWESTGGTLWMSGLRFDGNKSNQTAGTAILYCNTVSHVSDCIFTAGYLDAIRVSTSYATISNNESSSCNGVGVNVIAGSNYVSVVGNNVTGDTVTDSGTGTEIGHNAGDTKHRGFTATSAIDLDGNVLTMGGALLDTEGGALNTGAGTIDSEGGVIQSGSGDIDSEGGDIRSGGGLIDTEGGDLDVGTGDILQDGTKLKVPVSMTAFSETLAKNTVSSMFGGMRVTNSAAALSSGSPINAVLGIGRVAIVINAGSDVAGTITLTGNYVDKDTGAVTAGAENITIDAVSTDSSTTDAGGNTVYNMTGVYMSSRWYKGTVAISTADVTLTDVDVYSIAYTQGIRTGAVTLDSIDCEAFCIDGTNGQLFIHVYAVKKVSGSKYSVTPQGEDTTAMAITTTDATTNKWYRIRRGAINNDLDLTSDGIFAELQADQSPTVGFQNVTLTIWGKGALT